MVENGDSVLPSPFAVNLVDGQEEAACHTEMSRSLEAYIGEARMSSTTFPVKCVERVGTQPDLGVGARD